MARRLPKGFREGLSGELVCPHRDLSCCPGCARAHPEIVDVVGQHFWEADPVAREALKAELAAYESKEREAL